MNAYDEMNIFARIIRGEIPCDTVYADEYSLAFRDIAPAAPVHILVLPKNAYLSFDDFMHRAEAEEVVAFFQAVRNVADIMGVVESGYRVITNHGADASQTVPHFHVHVLGGAELGGLLPKDVLIR
jgi:diadenosine tetraphosphate (Ap4A) HIT family hydrolase